MPEARPATPVEGASSRPLPPPPPLLAACAAVTAVGVACYLWPSPVPGERLLVLACLVAFWALTAAALWRWPALRLFTIGIGIIQLFPIRSGLTRGAILAILAALWLGLAIANRPRPSTAIVILAAPLLVAALLLLPGRPVPQAALAREYVRSLTPYRGAVYIWGGENRVGIDCSGLVRCGWIDANLRVGLRTANPAPLRAALWTWLHDCSARDLGDGYRGRTRPVSAVRSLNRADYGVLRTGDIAVSESGLHTLAYLGGGEWIEAEPVLNGVKRVRIPARGDIWFDSPMRIVRWRALE